MKSHYRHFGFGAVLFSTSAILASLLYSLDTDASPLDGSEAFYPVTVSAEFRGCESAYSCRFWIASSPSTFESLYVVRPNGLIIETHREVIAIAVRNRLNSLMSNMIHQHKRIELQNLRKLDDGAYAATIEVNGMDVSADSILVNLTKDSKN